MVRADRAVFTPDGRTRRPPRDRANALLSFCYALLRAECEAALEGVGLDPQVGYLHALRPGRPALALDLMEELRPGDRRPARAPHGQPPSDSRRSLRGDAGRCREPQRAGPSCDPGGVRAAQGEAQCPTGSSRSASPSASSPTFRRASSPAISGGIYGTISPTSRAEAGPEGERSWRSSLRTTWPPTTLRAGDGCGGWRRPVKRTASASRSRCSSACLSDADMEMLVARLRAEIDETVDSIRIYRLREPLARHLLTFGAPATVRPAGHVGVLSHAAPRIFGDRSQAGRPRTISPIERADLGIPRARNAPLGMTTSGESTIIERTGPVTGVW